MKQESIIKINSYLNDNISKIKDYEAALQKINEIADFCRKEKNNSRIRYLYRNY